MNIFLSDGASGRTHRGKPNCKVANEIRVEKIEINLFGAEEMLIMNFYAAPLHISLG